MGRNVEIKARVDDLEALRKRVEGLADSGPSTVEQKDTFFRSRHGRLKLREMSDGVAELIYYARADTAEPIESNYLKVPCPEPAAIRQALASALGARGQVCKQRAIYLCGPTRIHLDSVAGLGDFVELEVVLAAEGGIEDGISVAHSLMAKLGIDPDDLVEESYIDLIEEPNDGVG
ncbi:MAG: class IV adenylate cyclase [Thermoanaerobaculia bacterium]